MFHQISARFLLALVVSAAAGLGVAAYKVGVAFQPHAQVLAANGQSATTPGIIDGTKHPELVPDSAAYRLYLLTVAKPADATNAERARQRVILKWSGLGDQDIPYAVAVLADFRAQYDDLIKQYNDSVVQADKVGEQPDLATFLSQRDALVQSVRDRLKLDMSPASMTRLNAHVQFEKRFMKVAKEGIQ